MNKLCYCFLLGLLTFTASASATTFDFSFSLPLVDENATDTGSGTITATEVSTGEYLVTGITGTTSAWGAITGLVPVGGYPPDVPAPNDNLLFYPATPYLDGDGLSFYVAGTGDSGTDEVNICYYCDDYFSLEAYHEIFSFEDGTFTITQRRAPLPNLLLLPFS